MIKKFRRYLDYFLVNKIFINVKRHNIELQAELAMLRHYIKSDSEEAEFLNNAIQQSEKIHFQLNRW